MKEFLKINWWKLKFAFKWTSISFTILVLIIFLIGYFKKQVPDIELFLTVIFGASIGMPLFIMVVASLRGAWDLHKRRNAFGKKPFSELKNYGFTEALKNENAKWSFSELILKGEIEGFLVRAEVDTQYAPNVIRFQALTVEEVIGKAEVFRLNRKFRSEDIDFDFEGLTKKVAIQDKRYSTIGELMTELRRFIRTLKREKFKSIKMTEHSIEQAPQLVNK